MTRWAAIGLALAATMTTLTGLEARAGQSGATKIATARITDDHPEAHILKSYAFIVCLRSAYATEPEGTFGTLVPFLDKEAWALVEGSRFEADVYAAVWDYAKKAGGSLPASAAVRGCQEWKAEISLEEIVF